MSFPGRRSFGAKQPSQIEALASLRTYLATARSIEDVTPTQIAHRFKVNAKTAAYELAMAQQRRSV